MHLNTAYHLVTLPPIKLVWGKIKTNTQSFWQQDTGWLSLSHPRQFSHLTSLGNSQWQKWDLLFNLPCRPAWLLRSWGACESSSHGISQIEGLFCFGAHGSVWGMMCQLGCGFYACWKPTSLLRPLLTTEASLWCNAVKRTGCWCGFFFGIFNGFYCKLPWDVLINGQSIFLINKQPGILTEGPPVHLCQRANEAKRERHPIRFSLPLPVFHHISFHYLLNKVLENR